MESSSEKIGGRRGTTAAMIPNIIQAIKDGAKIAASGFKTVDQETYDKRLEVCNGCEQLAGRQCKVCTCFVPLKAQFEVEECPLGKWPGNQPQPKPYVEPEVYHSRIQTCETCEMRRGRRCAGCSCNLYTMARLNSSVCPKNKWE